MAEARRGPPNPRPATYTDTMRVATDNSAIANSLQEMARLVVAGGGVVADDFTVHERDGFMWASISEELGVADRELVRYPQSVTVPFDDIVWESDFDSLVPTQPPTHLTEIQQGLLGSWLSIINSGRKLAALRRMLPSYSLTDEATRKHLAEGRHLETHSPDGPDQLHNAMCMMHAQAGMHPQPDGTVTQTRSRRSANLIPLKAFVNHDPSGSKQHRRRYGTDVVVLTSATSNETQTFEDYGDLDAMQTAINMGFVCRDARVVHMTPTHIEDPLVGIVRVNRAAPRKHRKGAQDVPVVQATEDGLALSVLTARPGNYHRVLALLSMVYQSKGLSTTRATEAAEALMVGVAEDTRNYLLELASLTRAAQHLDDSDLVLANLNLAATIQAQAIERWWLSAGRADSDTR